MDQVFSHSGDIGDLLAALPVIKQLGGGELVLFPASYTGWRMTKERVESLRPFLEMQPYVRGVRWNSNPEGTNLDNWRQHYDDSKNLTDIVAQTFGQPHPDREQPWLKIDRPNRIARIIFARSRRHRNHEVDWRQIYNEYAGEAVFAGTPDEHYDFQRAIGPVSYHYSPTYLELARIVAGGDMVVVNQTSIRWLAEGYKLPVLVEVDPGINNTHWQRTGAHYLYGSCDIPKLCEVEELAIRTVIRRAHGRTLLTDDRLENLARLARSVRHLPGELAELGIYRGGSASVIAACCPEKRLRLFDIREGVSGNEKVAGGNSKGEFAADFDEVKQFLQLYDVAYFVNDFADTNSMSTHHDTRYAFVHLDTDTYQNAKAALEYFLPRLVSGGVCVLDNYRWERCDGVEQSLRQLCPTAEIHTAAQQAWFRK